jgi:hypothetical protein
LLRKYSLGEATPRILVGASTGSAPVAKTSVTRS